MNRNDFLWQSSANADYPYKEKTDGGLMEEIAEEIKKHNNSMYDITTTGTTTTTTGTITYPPFNEEELKKENEKLKEENKILRKYMVRIKGIL